MYMNTIENNLAWLEHEMKIESSVSITQELKAKVNVLTLAVSTIADLNTTVKELKKEVETLKKEVKTLKSELFQNKKNITFEEREFLKDELTEKFDELRMIYPCLYTDEIIENVLNIIINKSKSFKHAYHVIQKA